MKTLREIRPRGTEDFPFTIYRCKKEEQGICTAPAHYHNDIEILQPLEGCMDLTVGSEQIKDRAGSIYFINPEEVHTLYTASSPAAYRCFIFGRELLNLPGNRVMASLIDPLHEGRMIFPRSVENEEIAGLLQEINQLEKTPHNGALILSDFLRLLALIAPQMVESEGQSKMEDPLRCAIDFMESHFAEKITLSKIAAVAGFNSQYFCSYFKKHTRFTPIEYLTSLRIRNAKNLLRYTDLSVLEVAMQSGFENVSFFIQKFKKATGTTPLAYRKSK
jgi:AraC-like DNA-binding protein